MDDFKSYPKIEQLGKLYMTITQKIHGTNAQVYIKELQFGTGFNVFAGSRTRWLTPEDDNHGFCKWVDENSKELMKVLGEGRHYGEWCGKGINNGEGLSTKSLVLFDWWKYTNVEKYPFYPFLSESLLIRTVPVLYKGPFSYEKINECMELLKSEGSRLTPVGWFMKPEGIVIDINGQKFKKVFEQEDIAWSKPDKIRSDIKEVDVSHLLQPVRFEKLIGQDEQYKRNYPENMKDLFSLYVKDLMDEGQIIGTDDEVKAIKKSLGKHLYSFIKGQMA